MRSSHSDIKERGVGLLIVPFILLAASIVSIALWSVVQQTLDIAKVTQSTIQQRLLQMENLAQELQRQSKSGCFQTEHYGFCIHQQKVTSDKLKVNWDSLLDGAEDCEGKCEVSLTGGVQALYGSVLNTNALCLDTPCTLAASGEISIDKLTTSQNVSIVAAKNIDIKTIENVASQPVTISLVSTQGSVTVEIASGKVMLNSYPSERPKINLVQKNPIGIPLLSGLEALWPLE